MQLNGIEFEKLKNALLDIYPTQGKLEQMKYKLNKNIFTIAQGSDLEEIIFNLIKTTEAEGWTKELVIERSLTN